MPTLYTPRLVLRPFTAADAKRVQELAGDLRVAQMTAVIPHPYPDGAAEAWIQSLAANEQAGNEFTFAVTLAGTRTPDRELDPTDTGHLIGAVGLGAGDDATEAILGYWIGVPYWNKGFATEAANAVVKFGFSRRGYLEMLSCHWAQNPASGRVMQKLGMLQTHTSTRFYPVRNQEMNVVHYALAREDWARRQIVHRWKPSQRTLATV